MYLLDTNTLIYFFKRQGKVEQHLKTIPKSQIHVPAVVWFELEYGLLRSSKPEQRRQLLQLTQNTYGSVPFDQACAKVCAGIKHALQTAGTPIGHYDLLIAGTALANNFTVVTRNTREFERVPGLKIENWYD